MPPLPKRKISYSRKRKRQAHKSRKVPGTTVCPNCGNAKMPHRVCPTCGTYAGRQVIRARQAAE